MANHSILYKLGKNFGKRTIMLCQYLLDKYDNNRIVARLVDQLLRCGTSIGANISEGQDAVSNADFVNKHAIALKEARETLYCSNCFMRLTTSPMTNSILSITTATN